MESNPRNSRAGSAVEFARRAQSPYGTALGGGVERDLAEREFLLRRRVQKLRWLGFDDQADRVAAVLHRSRRTGAPGAAVLSIEPPETD